MGRSYRRLVIIYRSFMDSDHFLKPFFEPRSVAIVGANPRTGDFAFNAIENLENFGYKGHIYPVNRKYAEILGRQCYTTVKDIPFHVELAVVVSPRNTVPGVIRRCGEKGIKSVVVPGQGFADADDEGKKLQQDIINLAKYYGIRILGPNTLGVLNPFANFTTSFLLLIDIHTLPIGMISQSGVFFTTVGRYSCFGKAIDVGNACDIDVADALEYFIQDEDVSVILLHIEGIIDGNRFRTAVTKATKAKPIICLKTGRSQEAAKAASSHTGSLIGSDYVWDALCKQTGIIRANSIDELSDLGKAFHYLPRPKGNRVAILSGSGGVGIIGIDVCIEHGLYPTKFAQSTKEHLKTIAPHWYEPKNPLDLWPFMMSSPKTATKAIESILNTVLNDENVDAVLFFGGTWWDDLIPSFVEIIVETTNQFPNKPIAISFSGGAILDVLAEHISERLEKAGKGFVFSNPNDAAKALAKLVDYSEFLSQS